VSVTVGAESVTSSGGLPVTLCRMFTGIVRERGRVLAAEHGRNDHGVSLRIEAPATAAMSKPGDSIAVAGCCLTATAVENGSLAFNAVPETIARSNLGGLAEGAEVNLEPALRVGEPLGGHFVQGHVDGLGRVRLLEPDGEGARLRLELDQELLRYCVEKGSLTVDGVSLTIAALDDTGVEIALVPFTLQETTLSALGTGDEVNVEVDLLAKYAERLATS
jgi:riboflavin synthase alpha subunit